MSTNSLPIFAMWRSRYAALARRGFRAATGASLVVAGCEVVAMTGRIDNCVGPSNPSWLQSADGVAMARRCCYRSFNNNNGPGAATKNSQGTRPANHGEQRCSYGQARGKGPGVGKPAPQRCSHRLS